MLEGQVHSQYDGGVVAAFGDNTTLPVPDTKSKCIATLWLESNTGEAKRDVDLDPGKHRRCP